jgi:hypothetical protein
MKQEDLPYTQYCIPFKLQASKEEAQQIINGHSKMVINHLEPNGHYSGRTTQLTSRLCI